LPERRFNGGSQSSESESDPVESEAHGTVHIKEERGKLLYAGVKEALKASESVLHYAPIPKLSLIPKGLLRIMEILEVRTEC
jgi:hypothetical protein